MQWDGLLALRKKRMVTLERLIEKIRHGPVADPTDIDGL